MHGPRVFARSRSEPRLSKKIERFTTPKGPKSHLCMAVTDRKDKAGAEDIPRYGPHKYIPAFVDTMHMSDTQYFDAVKKGLVHPVTAFRMDGKVTSTTQKKP
ncbi:hypothetical protein Tcan_02355 [Toxocara canis]|nr:hypothetical protein Tcan_02355 [Toxocara canis]